MKDNTNTIRLFPQRWQVLSGSWLKMIAILSMLIDHLAGFVLCYDNKFIEPLFTIGSKPINWYILMRLFGRLAFPIFAFLLVEGFQHTHDKMKYGRNLLLFALISEIPWDLIHYGQCYGPSQNVIFTLFFSYLALCSVGQWESKRLSTTRMATYIFGLIALSILLRTDHGSYGVGFVLLLYFLRQNHIFQAAAGCCYLGSRWLAGLAFIPINLYNGQRGFIQGTLGKYLFYIFYPLHLLVLYLIRI
ncbi:MAG: conjugal transfer protein TraX [Prevotella sp.]|nr:conjugal transfer protein TraX [Prevotella sp.]